MSLSPHRWRDHELRHLRMHRWTPEDVAAVADIVDRYPPGDPMSLVRALVSVVYVARADLDSSLAVARAALVAAGSIPPADLGDIVVVQQIAVARARIGAGGGDDSDDPDEARSYRLPSVSLDVFDSLASAFGDKDPAIEVFEVIKEAHHRRWAPPPPPPAPPKKVMPLPPSVVDLGALVEKLKKLRTKKLKSKKPEQNIRGALIRAVLDGDDLAVHEEGTGKILVDRDKALTSALSTIAANVPPQTRFEDVELLLTRCLSASLRPGEKLDDLVRDARSAFNFAIVSRYQSKKKKQADDAARQERVGKFLTRRR